MKIKLLPLPFIALFLLSFLIAGIWRWMNPVEVGDKLVSKNDGTVLGTVVEIRDYQFPRGRAPILSLHVKTPAGGDEWYSRGVIMSDYKASH